MFKKWVCKCERMITGVLYLIGFPFARACKFWELWCAFGHGHQTVFELKGVKWILFTGANEYCRKASLCKCVVWTVDHQVPITLTIKMQGKTLFDNKNTQSVYREIEI